MKSQIFIVLLIIGSVIQCYSNDAEKLISRLTGLGFDNVRAVLVEDTCMIAIENHVYWWEVRSIVTALGAIADNLEQPVTINLILLEKEIPGIVLKVESWVLRDETIRAFVAIPRGESPRDPSVAMKLRN